MWHTKSKKIILKSTFTDHIQINAENGFIWTKILDNNREALRCRGAYPTK